MTHQAETVTVYVSIGNSDDKLTQREWAEFAADFQFIMIEAANQAYGVWHSLPNSAYQNACIAIAIDQDAVEDLRRAIAALRAEYRQDSIALAVVPETEFI